MPSLRNGLGDPKPRCMSRRRAAAVVPEGLRMKGDESGESGAEDRRRRPDRWKEKLLIWLQGAVGWVGFNEATMRRPFF